MKKIFFILFAIICSSSLFAQIAQTFVPEAGKTYYIKPATNAQAAYRQFLVDNSGTLKFDKMTALSAKAATNAQWEIQYVTDNGYILKNKGTGSYVTNAVKTTSPTDGDKCYFEFRTSSDFYLGNAIQTKIYGIIIAGGTEGFNLSITENASTVNKWTYSNENNERFVIIPEDKVDKFDQPVESGGTYYIKSLSDRSGVKAGYVAEDAGAKLTVIPAADAANNLKAQWETTWVEGSGYTLKNKETGHYFTNTDPLTQSQDAVDLSSSTVSSYYTISYSPKTYKQGKYDNGVFTNVTFGGLYISTISPIYSLNAFGTTFFGLYGFDKNDGGSTDNSFIFQKISEAKFTTGITENTFTPVAGTKYYIKSIWSDTFWGKTQDQMIDVYVADNVGVKLETIDASSIKTSNMAQWYITFDETDGGYYFQNAGTNNHIKISNDGTISMAAKDDVNSFLFRIALYDSNSNPVYTYKNSTTENSFSSVGYHLINKSYNKELDLNRSKFTIGTWSPEDNPWKCWMILTETELTNLLNVKAGVITSSPSVSTDQTSVYCLNKVIYVTAEDIQGISVYNMQGQLLYSGTNTTIEGISGACIVKISTKNGISNHKLLVK